MKWFKLLLSLALLFTLMNSAIGIASADQPTPKINPQLPRPPEGAVLPQVDSLSAVTTSTVAIPSLKAVLIVGNIDGDTGYWTTAEVNNMKKAETVLRANGVNVTTFYPPNNNWSSIKTAATGAHFLLYRGHGVEWNVNPLIVGGFALSDGHNGFTLISNDQIRNELKPASNAIVMLYGCYTTGSYGDEVNVTSPEAQDRVYQYADPFTDIGAAGYYANWWGDAFEKYLISLFAGKTLGQAYKDYPDTNLATVEYLTFPTRSDLAMWLDKDYYSGGWKYNNAFVGKSGATLETLFATQMVPSPSPVTYLATVPSAARQQPVTVNGLGTITFQWQASLTSTTWAKLSTTTGTTGTSTTVTLNPTGLKSGTYQATLTFTTSTPGVLPNLKTVPVKLIVVDQIYQNFLPITTR